MSSCTVQKDSHTPGTFPRHAAQLNHLTRVPCGVACCPTTPRSLKFIFVVDLEVGFEDAVVVGEKEHVEHSDESDRIVNY